MRAGEGAWAADTCARRASLPPRRRQGGFTYFGVLFLLVLLGLGLAGTGETWTLASRRAKERELLWTGNQYARAIRSYYNQSPGLRQFPSQLEDLVEDRRFPEPRRHLRQLYADPITRDRFDIVLSQDGRIGGVRSRSDATPLKQDNFPQKFRDFKGATHYADWLFIADNLPGSPVRPTAAGTPPAAGTGTAPATASPDAGSAQGNPAAPANPAAPGTATAAGATPASGGGTPPASGTGATGATPATGTGATPTTGAGAGATPGAGSPPAVPGRPGIVVNRAR
jgi:type II secretory pathway pseudopilin PulG